MDMYEARQNKEKISRRIDTAAETKQRVKIGDKRSIGYFNNGFNKTIQRRDDLATKIGLAGGLGLAGAGIGTGFLIGGPIGGLVGGLIGGGVGAIFGTLAGKQVGTQLPPFTDIKLIGNKNEGTKSYASVESEAQLTGIDQKVVYEIKWDANVVPSGNHLEQNNVPPNTYVVDKAQNGIDTVGERSSPMHRYYEDQEYETPNPNGLFFHYVDGIEQDLLQGGSWWFRIRVIDRGGSTLSSSEVEIKW